MKKIYKLFAAIAILALGKQEAAAQCISATQYPSSTFTINSVPGSTTSITTCNYGGEYSVDNFTATGTYSATSSIATDYITVTDNANTPIAFGLTPLSFTINTTGIYRIHIAASAPPTCGTQSSCRTVRVIVPQVPCSMIPTATTVANAALLCPGAALTVSTNATYTGSGISFQWQSSTVGASGPFSAIGSATNTTYSAPSGTATTWYQLVATCSNGPVTGTSTPVQITPGIVQPTAAVTPTSLCSTNSANLSLTSAFTGVSYNWQSSPTGTAGSFSSIAGGTVTPLAVNGITATTYYRSILSCTANPAFSVTTQTVQVSAPAPTVATVPYFEGFETVTAGSWPNCSWIKTGDWTTATATLSNNRGPNTGVGYAYTAWSTIAGGDMLYSNGIQLNTGVTYSANTSYRTDGLSGWTELSMLLATAQNTAAITNTLSTVGAATNTVYAMLTNTFTVPSSGVYYLAYRVVANSTPWYLTIDDINVTAPCSLNAPVVAIAGGTAAVCSGNTVNLSASGASTYSWSSGATTSTVSVSPGSTTTYTVIGTNAVSCTNTAVQTVTVNPAPVVSVSGATAVCAGQSAVLTASGASTYVWSNAATTTTISASPTVTTVYTATGTANGCDGVGSLTVTVNANPVVSVSGATAVCAGQSAVLTASGASTYVWSNAATTTTISASPTVTTVYTATGTANGCDGVGSLTVNVNANPVVSVSGATAVCAGQSAVLTASGASTYVWSNAATTTTISASPTVTTVYTATGTANGCTGVASKTLVVNALPSVSLTAGATSVCVNTSTIALTGAPAGGVYTGSNVAGNVFTPGAVAGTFTPAYAYTDGNGCANTASATIIVSGCVGLANNTSSAAEFNAYPNPTSGVFTLAFNNGLEKTITVSDVSGKVVYTIVSDKAQIEINLSELSNGIYTVKVQGNQTVNVLKVVKQ
ncbi:MAG: T9SS type A sorting domain-containing protein [Sediminibacterium sp.]|nr:T9SS type A sorting domain-containing protein [Sediminibacterium sp.]